MKSPYQEKILKFKREAKKAHKKYESQLVVISGAGPAGLIRTIQCLVKGIPVKLLEKRKENSSSRMNLIALKEPAIEVLKEYGVYQYLEENGLIYPCRTRWTTIEISTLENALRAVINDLKTGEVILYETFITHIHEKEGKTVDLEVNHQRKPLVFRNVSLLVIAEGAHSQTAERFLKLSKRQILPEIQVFYAMLKKSEVFSPFLRYIRGAWRFLISYPAYIKHAVRAFFHGEKKNVILTILTETPRHVCFGFILNAKSTSRILSDPKIFTQNIMKSFSRKLKSWLYYVFWHKIHFSTNSEFMNLVGHPWKLFFFNDFASMHIVPTGSRCATSSTGKIGKTPFLLVGDSLMTVDICSGNGCNMAIHTAKHFSKYLESLESEEKRETALLKEYQLGLLDDLKKAYKFSLDTRASYRPDTLETYSFYFPLNN